STATIRAPHSAALPMRPLWRRHRLHMNGPGSFYQNDIGGSRLRRLRQVATTVSRQRCYKMFRPLAHEGACVMTVARNGRGKFLLGAALVVTGVVGIAVPRSMTAQSSDAV